MRWYLGLSRVQYVAGGGGGVGYIINKGAVCRLLKGQDIYMYMYVKEIGRIKKEKWERLTEKPSWQPRYPPSRRGRPSWHL